MPISSLEQLSVAWSSSRDTVRSAACGPRSTTRCRSRASRRWSTTSPSSPRRRAEGVVEKFRIQVRNHISGRGLQRFPWDRFAVSAEQEEPDAILVRSADLHKVQIPASVLAIGRAGTNNIPVTAMSARGIPVFNAPGANANAVKELVLAGMLLAARNLDGALKYV